MSTQYVVHYNSRRTLNFTRFFHRNYLQLAYSAVCFTLPTDLLLSRKTMSNSHSLQHISLKCIVSHFISYTVLRIRGPNCIQSWLSCMQKCSVFHFRFPKTIGRYIRFLLQVSILTTFSTYVCHSALSYQISAKLDRPRLSYDVIAIFKIAILRQGNDRPPAKCVWWFWNLNLQVSSWSDS